MARLLHAFLAALLLALAPLLAPGFAGPALAQETAAAPPDHAAWERDATRAETVLEEGRASNLALEQLRQTVVGWRDRFAAAQTANQSRIETLRGQIAALGPAPAEGVAEAPEIAARRAELTAQLATAEAPRLAAVEAYSRADGIIRQIDGTIRERQADALLRLSPSPANPANWPAAAAVLTKGLATLANETRGAWENPTRRAELRNNLPAILLYLVLAGLLMIRGPGFMERLTSRIQTRMSARGRPIAAAVVSMGEVALPVAGMYLLVMAISATGMAGLRTSALIEALPLAAFAFFGARWLGGWLFRANDAGLPGGADYALIDSGRAEGRFHLAMIGLMLALEVFRRAFITEVRPPLSQAAQSVWATPLVLVMALFLFRLGMLLRRPDRAEGEDGLGEDRRFVERMRVIVGTLVAVIAVLAPVLAVVGYVAAAEALIWPTVLSLGLMGLLILLQRFLTDIYLIVTRSGEEGREALIPVLVGFGLFLGALPAFALVWGARVADLNEAWTRFRTGFAIGETRISPSVLLVFVILFVIGYMATRLVQGALKASVLPRTRLDKGVQNAVVAGIGYVGIFLSALVAITAAGLDLSSLAIVAGALSVGIGFGLQNIVQNFVSGIILLIERPISEGDMIEAGGKIGIVRAISVRSTRIETFDRTDVIVPNADLVSGVVTNWTRGNLTGRLVVPISVAYGADTRKVERILREIAEAHPMVVVNPPPGVFFVGFSADALNFEIRAILRDVNFKGSTHSDMNHEIVRRFGEEAIPIAIQQRVWIQNAVRIPPRQEAVEAPQDKTGDEA